MRTTKGLVYTLILLLATTMVGYSSDHFPTIKKEKQVCTYSPSAHAYAVCMDAILPSAFRFESYPTYLMVWCIGRPTTQAEEHYLCSRSLCEMKYNRMKNSK